MLKQDKKEKSPPEAKKDKAVKVNTRPVNIEERNARFDVYYNYTKVYRR